MTSNQLRYWELQESKRANLAKEAENFRSNKAKELETRRSNIANETEINRSNLAKEYETNRANTETQRHNLQTEYLTDKGQKRQLAGTIISSTISAAGRIGSSMLKSSIFGG